MMHILTEYKQVTKSALFAKDGTKLTRFLHCASFGGQYTLLVSALYAENAHITSVVHMK